MTNPYTTQTIANYNTSPPADDASAVASNQLFWSKHKDKLADPIKVLSEAINTELVAVFAKLHLNGKRAITANDTQLAADERKLISATNTITYTLLPSATAADGFTVAVLNAGTGVITIEADGSELIDGALNTTLENQYDIIFLRCDGAGWNIVHAKSISNITLGTEQASTSGTSIDFTALPAGLKRITVMFDDVSTNGTSEYIIQLGDIDGFEITGYDCLVTNGAGTDLISTIGFVINETPATGDQNKGAITFTRMNATHKWVATGIIIVGGGTPETWTSAGAKTLSAELTQVRITTTGGANTFDNGTINIAYE